MTVALYAWRRGIPVEDIEGLAERDASRERDGEYSLTVHLRIRAGLSDSQLLELDAVALKCPIHKLMTLAKANIATSVTRLG
jgi:putative redox protein